MFGWRFPVSGGTVIASYSRHLVRTHHRSRVPVKWISGGRELELLAGGHPTGCARPVPGTRRLGDQWRKTRHGDPPVFDPWNPEPTPTGTGSSSRSGRLGHVRILIGVLVVRWSNRHHQSSNCYITNSGHREVPGRQRNGAARPSTALDRPPPPRPSGRRTHPDDEQSIRIPGDERGRT